jgi:hypothetical protein
MTIGIFVSFALAAFELANRLITIAPEHCIAFEHSLTKVLEYINANGPATEGWYPRVGKLAGDHTVTTLVKVPQEASAAHSLHE